jgi:hypothetical protein
MVNFFYLDKDTEKCAEFYGDKHIVKIPIEIGQILSKIHHELKTGIIKYNPDLLRDDDTDNNYSLDFYHMLLFLKDNLIKEKWLKICTKHELLDELKTAALIKK